MCVVDKWREINGLALAQRLEAHTERSRPLIVAVLGAGDAEGPRARCTLACHGVT